MIHYAIHDLVDVLVDPRVNESIIGSIDFQIGYFKTTDNQLSAPHKIIIKPYDDFIPDPALIFDTFHLTRGISGQYLDDPNDEVALKRDKFGYTIYANSPNFLINLFIQFLLIEHGISMVHAAAVADRNGNVTLMPGAGGVGKTALLGYMVKEYDYRLLGDDIIGLSEKGDCLSFPRSFVLKEYHRSVYPEVFQRLNIGKQQETKVKAVSFKLKRVLLENAPFIGILKVILRRLDLLNTVARHFLTPNSLPFLAAPSVEEIFGPGSVVDHGNIEHIIFLQRYAGTKLQFVPISEEELCRRMFAIILHEWVGSMRHFFTMGALEIVDLPAYFDRVVEIIRKGISGKKCKMLLIPDNILPQEMSRYFIENFD